MITNELDRISFVVAAENTATEFSCAPLEVLDGTTVEVYKDGARFTGSVSVVSTRANYGGQRAASTFSIQFATAPTAGTYVVVRVPQYTQPVELSDSARWTPKILEAALDRAAIALTGSRRRLDRTLRAPSQEIPLATLPAAATRAGKFLSFDSSGQPTTSDSAGGSSDGGGGPGTDQTARDAAAAAQATADAALPLAGGTMTGKITLDSAPTADLHAATKAYVDSNAGSVTGSAGFRAFTPLTTPADVTSDVSIPASGTNPAIYTLLDAHEFPGPISSALDFFTEWEGSLILEMGSACRAQVSVHTTHAFGTGFAKQFVHTRNFAVDAGTGVRTSVAMGVFDSVSQVPVGTFRDITITEADLALPSKITYQVEIQSFQRKGTNRNTNTLKYLSFDSIDVISFQIGAGNMGGVDAAARADALSGITKADAAQSAADAAQSTADAAQADATAAQMDAETAATTAAAAQTDADAAQVGVNANADNIDRLTHLTRDLHIGRVTHTWADADDSDGDVYWTVPVNNAITLTDANFNNAGASVTIPASTSERTTYVFVRLAAGTDTSNLRMYSNSQGYAPANVWGMAADEGVTVADSDDYDYYMAVINLNETAEETWTLQEREDIDHTRFDGSLGGEALGQLPPAVLAGTREPETSDGKDGDFWVAGLDNGSTLSISENVLGSWVEIGRAQEGGGTGGTDATARSAAAAAQADADSNTGDIDDLRHLTRDLHSPAPVNDWDDAADSDGDMYQALSSSTDSLTDDNFDNGGASLTVSSNAATQVYVRLPIGEDHTDYRIVFGTGFKRSREGNLWTAPSYPAAASTTYQYWRADGFSNGANTSIKLQKREATLNNTFFSGRLEGVALAEIDDLQHLTRDLHTLVEPPTWEDAADSEGDVYQVIDPGSAVTLTDGNFAGNGASVQIPDGQNVKTIIFVRLPATADHTDYRITFDDRQPTTGNTWREKLGPSATFRYFRVTEVDNYGFSMVQLEKKSAAISETRYTGEGSIPGGGSSGQALVKSSADDYDVEWGTVSGGTGGGGGPDTTARNAAAAAQATADAALSRTGGTMTGKITLDGPPNVDLHAATKKYVDDNIGSGRLDGGPFLEEIGASAALALDADTVADTGLDMPDSVATGEVWAIKVGGERYDDLAFFFPTEISTGLGAEIGTTLDPDSGAGDNAGVTIRSRRANSTQQDTIVLAQDSTGNIVIASSHARLDPSITLYRVHGGGGSSSGDDSGGSSGDDSGGGSSSPETLYEDAAAHTYDHDGFRNITLSRAPAAGTVLQFRLTSEPTNLMSNTIYMPADAFLALEVPDSGATGYNANWPSPGNKSWIGVAPAAVDAAARITYTIGGNEWSHLTFLFVRRQSDTSMDVLYTFDGIDRSATLKIEEMPNGSAGGGGSSSGGTGTSTAATTQITTDTALARNRFVEVPVDPWPEDDDYVMVFQDGGALRQGFLTRWGDIPTTDSTSTTITASGTNAAFPFSSVARDSISTSAASVFVGYLRRRTNGTHIGAGFGFAQNAGTFRIELVKFPSGGGGGGQLKDLDNLPAVASHEEGDLVAVDDLWYKLATTDETTANLFGGDVGRDVFNTTAGERWRGISNSQSPNGFSTDGEFTANPSNTLSLLLASSSRHLRVAMKRSVYEAAKGSDFSPSDHIAIKVTMADGSTTDEAVLAYYNSYTRTDRYIIWQHRHATDNYNLYSEAAGNAVTIEFFTTTGSTPAATTTPLFTHEAALKHWIHWPTGDDPTEDGRNALALAQANAARLDALDMHVDGVAEPIHSQTYDEDTALLAPTSGNAGNFAISQAFTDILPDDLLVVDWKKCEHLNHHDEYVVPGSDTDSGRMYLHPRNFDNTEWNGEFVYALDRAIQDNGAADTLNSWIVGSILFSGSTLTFGLHLQQGGTRTNRNLKPQAGFSLALRIYRNSAQSVPTSAPFKGIELGRLVGHDSNHLGEQPWTALATGVTTSDGPGSGYSHWLSIPMHSYLTLDAGLGIILEMKRTGVTTQFSQVFIPWHAIGNWDGRATSYEMWGGSWKASGTSNNDRIEVRGRINAGRIELQAACGGADDEGTLHAYIAT